MFVRIRGLVSLILIATTVLAGCHLIDGQGPIERWRGLASDLRLHWSAESGIDILTGAAVPVRAYTLNQRILARLHGKYRLCLSRIQPRGTTKRPQGQLRHRCPEPQTRLDRPVPNALIGNERYHILSLARSGRNITATLCNYRYAVGMPADNGMFKSVQTGVGDSRGIYAERVTLVAPVGRIGLCCPLNLAHNRRRATMSSATGR